MKRWILTGGIACGKSMVLNSLHQQKGIRTFSSDLAVHELLDEDRVRTAILDRFGAEVFGLDGKVDRRKLGKQVFGENEARLWLENLIHPLVFDRLESDAAAAESMAEVHLFVAEIPLHYEVKSPVGADRVVAVLCSPERQLQRLMSHRGLTRDKSESILRVQMPILEKATHADVVIWNDGSPEAVQRQVELLIAQIAHDGN
ncbi:MAG: dephospho-CoA kinase [Verrucomicrobiales bacterium]|nr:dephospho-CoA kinase [Verrucomicrobiales bacterium]